MIVYRLILKTAPLELDLSMIQLMVTGKLRFIRKSGCSFALSVDVKTLVQIVTLWHVRIIRLRITLSAWQQALILDLS